ncbi:type II toxin-antitoxin system RelE/ParE family toxin [Candidatus Latescibacterota bacterium]
MSYKIAFKKSVAHDLKKISKDKTETILRKIEKDLPEKADTFPFLTGKFASLRKYRVGDYRIIYSIIGDTVLVLRICHRREAYR